MTQVLVDMEADYWHTPAFAQPRELAAINELRTRLGLPTVDSNLRVPTVKPTATKPTTDHTEARELVCRAVAKRTEGDRHREYATRLCKATEGVGKTPVRPLATMGTDCGELLCDHCGKPIILEGGQFHKLTSAQGWAKNGGQDFTSYILGGVVFEITYNGSVRVYHGHLGNRADECSTQGHNAIEEAGNAHVMRVPDGVGSKLRAFLASENPMLPEKELGRLTGEVLGELYGFDPGYGINQPSEK